MTKEDFKKKYHGKSVKIEASMQVHHLGEIADKPRRIQEMCKLMGLETHQVTVPAPYLLITIVDKQQEFRTNAEPLTPISEEEFLADFKEVHEELEFGVAKHNFIDFVEMFFIPMWEETKEGDITIIGVPIQKFNSEQQERLNKLKEHAEDVEFEEIQG